MMFLRYLPFAIEQGRLYAANPPLYGADLGKGKMKFFVDNLDYIEYVQSIFCRDNVIKTLSGKTMSKSEILQFLYRNMDYVKYITRISSTYAIDPTFLEFLLYNRELGFAKFKRTVETVYKFVKVELKNTTIVIQGLVGTNWHNVFFNDQFLNECTAIIDLMKQNDRLYILNNQSVTPYHIMLLFSNLEPDNITRYKGLGLNLSL